MRVEPTTPAEYAKWLDPPNTFFHGVPFHLHNRHKAKDLQFLLFRDAKVRGGIVGDIQSGCFRSPFSAPYGGLNGKGTVSFDQLADMYTALAAYAKATSIIHSMEITLPPFCYEEQLASPQVLAALHAGWQVKHIDHNQHFELSDFLGEDHYIESLPRSARKNIRRALKSDLEFIVADSDDMQSLAYGIIAKNRAERGFPLHLTELEVMSTAALTHADFFLVYAKDKAVAAAIVFEVAPRVVQVIYWGNLEEAAAFRPMNFLAYRVFAFYYQKGYKLVDIGPSSKEGVPNRGLISFKESIGCRSSLKYSIKYE